MRSKQDFQIIIPMTGHGSRFKSAGYERLKPFIEVGGRPILEWVVRMFPGDEDRMIFICRQEHLDELDYVSRELSRIAPEASVLSLTNWEKKGPVNDVLRASSIIDDNAPAIICYCDYYMHWDYETFIDSVYENGCDGAVPCYSGFHPHLIYPDNLYASCYVDKNDYLIEIREKYSWEKDKTKARHSPGLYYFKSGRLLKEYCQRLMDDQHDISGEYYASLPYNYMVQDSLKVWCPVNVSHFCQWGTPRDLEDYLFWTNTVKRFL